MSPHPSPVAKQWPSPVAQWHAHTRPARGHLIWTGSLSGGLPVIDWRGHRHQARRIAFTIRTGRQPVGEVQATCGKALCVHPRHVQDAAERRRDQVMLAALRTGGGAA